MATDVKDAAVTENDLRWILNSAFNQRLSKAGAQEVAFKTGAEEEPGWVLKPKWILTASQYLLLFKDNFTGPQEALRPLRLQYYSREWSSQDLPFQFKP